jgi:hypothetical protein
VNPDVPRRARDRSIHRPGAAALGIVVVGLLAGCGGGGGGSDGSSSPPRQGRNPPTATTTIASDRGLPAKLKNRLNRPRTPTQHIRGTVNLVLTVARPSVCSTPFVTRRYVEAAYGGHQGCLKAEVPGSAADELDFKSVEINGDTARAVVVPSGGPSNGDRLTVSLVLRDGMWAVDALHSNVAVGP